MNTRTPDFAPLDRVYQSGAVAEMRARGRGFWKKHGAQAFWFIAALVAIAGPLLYAEWLLP